ncbi:MAG: hypothetical protein MUF04_12130, partial [Akkermansiaceae bacterium]|nr:hypothetical protein [Akkermansiaceae bacterium]
MPSSGIADFAWTVNTPAGDNHVLAAFAPLVPGSTFAGWIATFPGVDGLTDVDDDPDGDGIANGVENFFGTHPGEFSQGLLAGTRSGNTFIFIHPQNASPAGDVTPAYRWSTNLIDWYAGDNVDGPGGGLTVGIAAA